MQIKLVNTCEIQIVFVICALSLSLFISVAFAQFDKKVYLISFSKTLAIFKILFFFASSWHAVPAQ